MYKVGVKMYKIIYMKADFEPWWKFEDWETHIVETFCFDDKKKFQEGLDALLEKFRKKYKYEEFRDQKYYAFWSEEEKEFCDSCDEEVQIYHGIIIEKVE